MRFTKVAIALTALLVLALAFGAQADGKGSVTATLYEASPYLIVPGLVRTYADGDAVGSVIFHATKDDTLQIKIKIQDGLPDTTFEVTFVPSNSANADLNWVAPPLSLTTDGKGKGSLTTELDIPAAYLETGIAAIKVILTSGDDLYATDDREPPFVNPPAFNPGSTTTAVSLK